MTELRYPFDATILDSADWSALDPAGLRSLLAAGYLGGLTIRWQITQLGRATSLKPPKIDGSDTTIALDTGTVTALRNHRTRQHRSAPPTAADHFGAQPWRPGLS